MQFQKSRKRQQKADRLAARESEKEAERKAVVYTLRIQDLLTNMGDEDKDNFRTGTNGALVRGWGDGYTVCSCPCVHSCCLSLSCSNMMLTCLALLTCLAAVKTFRIWGLSGVVGDMPLTTVSGEVSFERFCPNY